MLTTKKMPIKTLIHELLWFISGETNTKYLRENGVKIWDGFADKNGDLGPVYGYQWRHWPDYKGGHIDQLADAIHEIKTNPNSKAIIVNAWNVGQLEEMRLPPCHTFFQFYPRRGKLSCLLYQRSADVFIGVPFNIAEYSLLTMMVAQVTGCEPDEFVHILGDAHIYKNHKEQVLEQLQRKPLALPRMKINPEIKDIDGFTIDDFELINYSPHPKIEAKVVIV